MKFFFKIDQNAAAGHWFVVKFGESVDIFFSREPRPSDDDGYNVFGLEPLSGGVLTISGDFEGGLRICGVIWQ